MSTYKVVKTYGHDKGFSCAFRQWSADSHCSYIHGYSLGFIITLGADELNQKNWVYDFGNFSFLENWLRDHFDHTLLVAVNDPHIEEVIELNEKEIKGFFNIINKIKKKKFDQCYIYNDSLRLYLISKLAGIN